MFHADKDTAWSEFSGVEFRARAYALENKVSSAEIGPGDETGLTLPPLRLTANRCRPTKSRNVVYERHCIPPFVCIRSRPLSLQDDGG
jgi:hypothetical protein